MFETTLENIYAHGLNEESWATLLRYLCKTKADNEPLLLLTILESNGLNDALRCSHTVEGHDKDFRLFHVWCGRQVQHLMPDEHSLHALDVAERHALGEATEAELTEAAGAAAKNFTSWAVTSAAQDAAAWAAATDAANTVWAATWAAAKNSASWAAIDAASDYAVFVAALDAASQAADAAKARARATLHKAQEARFRQMLMDGGFIGSTAPEPCTT